MPSVSPSQCFPALNLSGTCQCAFGIRAIQYSSLTLENVLVLLLDLGKDLRRQTEVLRNNCFRGVLNPLIQQKCRILREATAVEDEKKLGAILAEPLQRVRVSRWEVPQITSFEVVDE